MKAVGNAGVGEWNELMLIWACAYVFCILYLPKIFRWCHTGLFFEHTVNILGVFQPWVVSYLGDCPSGCESVLGLDYEEIPDMISCRLSVILLSPLSARETRTAKLILCNRVCHNRIAVQQMSHHGEISHRPHNCSDYEVLLKWQHNLWRLPVCVGRSDQGMLCNRRGSWLWVSYPFCKSTQKFWDFFTGIKKIYFFFREYVA